MSTVTLQLDDHKVEKLAAAAREQGIEIAVLLEKLADDFIARLKPAGTDFNKALAASVKENEELLRRLAK
ncbi:hypothetical protein GobsT_00360 [Gemmata obscuriglobus]|uniref:Uncharacterized protein n=1 Tax=Gemmata obscuriglobus TaxID=114 RepID=A0A2Z3HEF1_9BACT|nr:hypothetical protein [Gemmata obscuriglobus]AWM41335.1 hypothetical protein C1280_32955 [Gemmata obscuriglobus]QEG25312.1 hypothetical protein GobsT_00360 [Gemmata obscuriglobus]VTR98198.1 unnamed protein product [Gemmata obscuriglobus UQM 2246]